MDWNLAWVCCVNSNGTPMSGNPLHSHDFKAVAFENMTETAQRVITQMFVINRVILQRLDEIQQVVRFRDENAVRPQHRFHGRDNLMDVTDVSKYVGSCHDARAPMFIYSPRG